MGRPNKFQGSQLKHVVSLLREHGPTETRKILAAPLMRVVGRGSKKREEPHPLGSLRSAKLFPEPVKVSMPTLGKIAAENELEFQRGKANPLDIVKNASRVKAHAVSLVKQHGAVQAAEILAVEPNGVTVCAATLRKLAKDAGLTLVRGRRKAA